MSARSLSGYDRKGVMVVKIHGVFGTERTPVKVFVGYQATARATAFAARYGAKNQCGTTLETIRVADD